MRIKRVHMSFEVVTQALLGGLMAYTTNLPEDTEVIHAKSIPMDGGWYRLELIVHSKDFDEVPEGADVPYLDGVEGYARPLSLADVLRRGGAYWDDFKRGREDAQL